MFNSYCSNYDPLISFQMTIRLARFLVVISWILGFITSIWFSMSLHLVTDRNGRVGCDTRSTQSWITDALLLLIIATQWLPGVVFTAAYIKIILKLRRDSAINPSDVSQSSQNRHRRNLRAARILVIEVVLFLACLYPFYHYSMARAFANGASVVPMSVEGMLVYCLMMTYSLINPFCHILFNSEFRGELVKMNYQLKVFCHLEKNRVSECSHCHRSGWHVHYEETRNNEERTNTIREE